MLLLLSHAFAGDVALYERALSLVDEHYLHPAQVDRVRMFADAGRQLESSVEWLLVDVNGNELQLSDGQGDWRATLRYDPETDLAAALGSLEDAVAAARRPLADGVDARVEILRGVVRSLDRHSVILYAQGLERFDERLSGTLVGIGAVFTRTGAELVVQETTPGGPAARAGLLAGDRLLKIDGVSTVGMEPRDAGTRIRGPEGTPVVLTLRRGADVLELSLLREEVRIRNVSATVGPNGIGVVTIEHFSEQTHDWLRESLDELGARDALRAGVTLDLRGNTGGSLLQSADAADTFLQSGLIVSTAGRDGGPVAGLVSRLDAQPDQPPMAMPLAVLMDHSTASGSEILAGSLASLDRALLIGTTSFGKGTVQKVYQIAPDIKLKLTVAEYLLDGGRRVVDVGLAPDLALSPVKFSADGVWYPELGRERARLPASTAILPAVEEAPGWRPRSDPPPARDVALDVAARLLAAAEGASRTKLLETLRMLRVRLQDDEDARVVDAFGARGIDWTAPPASWTPHDPKVHVRVDFHNPPTAGQATEIVASVRNEGTDLYRAAVRLRSVNRLWDDKVLPLGRVNGGAARTGTVVVHVPADVPTRADDIEVLLEAAGVPARVETRTRVTVIGAELPAVVGTARVAASPGQTNVVLTLENRSERLLTGVRARFEFPDVDGIELVDDGTAAVSLQPGELKTFLVRLSVADTWRDPRLPLDLVVGADGFGTLERWPLQLPRDGTALRLESPTLQVRALEPIEPVGSVTLNVRAADDRGLDHVVVSAGPETMNRARYEPFIEFDPDKVAYRAGSGKRTEVTVDVPIREGVNRYEIVAVDKTGLRTTRTLYLLGDPTPAAVDGAP